jgi:hypothetical protein
VIELERLFRQFDGASFAQRAQLAAEVAAAMTAADLDAALAGLAHASLSVRLGVLELVRVAGHRGAVPALHAHARGHGGDDRVFALRALAELAGPDDHDLRADALAWARGGDAFVAAQATRLLAVLGPGPAAARGALVREAEALFAATRTSERIARLAAIEAHGPAAIAAIAKPALTRGPADLVALVARALIRHAAALPSCDAIVALLAPAHRRVGDDPAAAIALDDAALVLGGVAHAGPLVARLDGLAPPTVAALAAVLEAAPPDAVAPLVAGLAAAVVRRPALWSPLGPSLARSAAVARADAALRTAVAALLAELRAERPQPPLAVASAARVLAAVAQPGEPLPRHLVAALTAVPAVAATQALVALCLRLATEAAAEALLTVTRSAVDDHRAVALAALTAWRSPWVELSAGPPLGLQARYVDGAGAPLVRTDRRLLAGDAAYALGGDGAPVRIEATAYGACLCCGPPLALVRPPGAGLRCPASWLRYLRDGAQVIREDDHPLGRCRRCDSDRPRARDGDRVVCPACGDGRAPAAPGPSGPAHIPVGDHPDAPPLAPSPEALAAMTPTIRAAMAANVFVRGRDGDNSYSASGIVIARDGERVAILTNRHVVEADDSGRLCPLDAVTVAGALREVTTVWRADRGVDLALIEGHLDAPEAVAVMPLGDGAAEIGARVFAIGNPLGLPWSYSNGTLSAVRDWTSRAGLPVRVLQTDTSIAPGSSGGGLWHVDGHLLGVIAFGQQGLHGSPVQFALSIAAVRAAFARSDLRWRGRRLADLP